MSTNRKQIKDNFRSCIADIVYNYLYEDESNDLLRQYQESNMQFEHSSDEMKDDFNVALYALSIDINNMKFVSERLKSNESFIYKAVMENTDALLYIDKSFLKDRIFIMNLMKHNDCVYAYLDENGKYDHSIIFAAIAANEEMVHEMNFDRIDDNSVIEIVRNFPQAFKHLPSSVKDVYTVSFVAVSADGKNLKHVCDKFKSDIDINIAAVHNTTDAFDYVDNKFMKNYKFFTTLIRSNPLLIEYFDKEDIKSMIPRQNSSTLDTTNIDLNQKIDEVIRCLTELKSATK